jgi:CDP-diacylglycerol pyrophosphatase
VKRQPGYALIRRQAEFQIWSPLPKLAILSAAMGLAAAVAAAQPHSVAAADRSELWFVVHDMCLPAYRSTDVPFPCLEVNNANGEERGYAVLQAPLSATHVVVVPTTRISGIESPKLQSDDAPNYWQAAWEARRYVEQGAGRPLPRDEIGMAINSAATRSQDQLHIHVSCVAPAVADFLSHHQAEIHGHWSFLRAKLAGHRFMAMKIETESLAKDDPFKLLARGRPANEFSAGRQMLAVIGAAFRDGKSGFYLLANDPAASPREIARAEALLDDKCAN